MTNQTGVYKAQTKDGKTYFRSSITYKGKHISLGSFDDEAMASTAYLKADEILHSACGITEYDSFDILDFKKYVMLVNFRDNNIYIKTPIYLGKKNFLYYLGREDVLKFDVDDLFYYSNHSIMRRGNHLFVANFGMQENILSRYGIMPHSVCGRDYFFANGDNTDFTYANIIIKNKYHGVFHIVKNGRDLYKVKIHIKGDYVVGTYRTEEEAAIAYNKAADTLRQNGLKKSFPENYPESLTAIAYASIYNSVRISKKISNYRPD